jgi:putative endonuclease
VEPWFVYVVRCTDGSFYVGIARDVAARLAAHDAGRGAKYTRGRGPVTLLARRRCQSKGDALRLELALKRLRRGAKVDVVAAPSRFARFARAVRVAHLQKEAVAQKAAGAKRAGIAAGPASRPAMKKRSNEL